MLSTGVRTLLLTACGLLLLPIGNTNDDGIEDLLSQMTSDERISILSTRSPAIARLNLTSFNWWTECLHGAKVGSGGGQVPATFFPSPLGMAASFDTQLLQDVGDIISTEMRAYNNEEHRLHNRSRMLSGWDPNINIFRDPRWGRGQETYGEDPHLTGRLAVSFVRGLQGDQHLLKVAATCKHFAAYSLEQADGTTRFRFNAKLHPRDIQETYLPAFEACVRKGHVQQIMCSYNAVDGVPACASDQLLGAVGVLGSGGVRLWCRGSRRITSPLPQL